MTVQAKQQLLTDVTADIGEFLTVTQTNSVRSALSDRLNEYELIELKAGDPDPYALDMLTMFLDAKRIEGRSEKTIGRYSYLLERMIRDIGLPIEKITVFHLRSYLMQEKNRGLSDTSLQGIRATMSSFFGWLWKENLLQSNPCANIGVIKCQKKIFLPFSATDIEKLKNGCTNARDRSLVCFLLSTGARVSEVTALNRDDIDFQNLECTVLGKGNKERTVYLDEVTAMNLKDYLSERTDSQDALFVARKGAHSRLLKSSVEHVLRDLGQRSGVENVHPHRFRRTLATNLINHGMPVQEVAVILGHENINTTMRYVFIDKTNVKNSYRRYS